MNYISQTPTLLPATVHANISRFGAAYAIDYAAMDAQVIDAGKRAAAHDVILKLPKEYDIPLAICEDGGLSAGQWQLIALGRGLSGQLHILSLNELIAHSDAGSEAAPMETLKAASPWRCHHHRLESPTGLLQAADRILLLRDGEVHLSKSVEDPLRHQLTPALRTSAGAAFALRFPKTVGSRCRRMTMEIFTTGSYGDPAHLHDIPRRVLIIDTMIAKLIFVVFLFWTAVTRPDAAAPGDGQPIPDTVPDAAPLEFRAGFLTEAIDGVQASSTVEFNLLSLHERDLTILLSKMRSASADSSKDERRGLRHFTAQIVVPDVQAVLLQQVRSADTGIRPGISVRVTAKLCVRLVLQNMLDPRTESMSHGFCKR